VSYQNLAKSGSFYPDDIQPFASQVGIDADIVVGGLQHDGYIQNLRLTYYVLSLKVRRCRFIPGAF
jgi:hypothetical protein